VRVVARSTRRAFWQQKPANLDAREPTRAGYRRVVGADWATPADLRRDFRTAGILRDGRAVFNRAGNEYRLVVCINHPYRTVCVRFIGTDRQYDDIDAQSI
jgi:mRNA interferase HigB